MADAKKCDRCGRFYEEPKTESFDIFSDSFADKALKNAQKHLDLCPKCKDDFMNFMKYKQMLIDEI